MASPKGLDGSFAASPTAPVAKLRFARIEPGAHQHAQEMVTLESLVPGIQSDRQDPGCQYHQPGLERIVVIVETRVNDLGIST